MKILVCGGRKYTNYTKVCEILNHYNDRSFEPLVIIHGGAQGADYLAHKWTREKSVPVHVYKPKWNKHGRAAGIIRNVEMLQSGKPDLVIAFPGGVGTADMVKRAKKAGVPVDEIVDNCEIVDKVYNVPRGI